MKLFYKGKDGGQESTVTGYWLIEWKRLFSVVLLRFDGLSREAYHTHAFNSISWVLKGHLTEYFLDGVSPGGPFCRGVKFHDPSLVPVRTYRNTSHKVNSTGRTWVLSFRGPWSKTWEEYLPQEDEYRTLTDGRVEV